MNKNELRKLLREATNSMGLFEVTIVLADVAQEDSRTYQEAGNLHAVVHKDAQSITRCLDEMVDNNHLRQLTYAS